MTDSGEHSFIIPPEIIEEIDVYLEGFYSKSKTAAEELVKASLTPTQVRALEKIVCSSTRFSEIINHIKNQAGKDKTKRWMQVASLLLGQLEELEAKAGSMKHRFLITHQLLRMIEGEGIDKLSINDLRKKSLNRYIKRQELFSLLERDIIEENDNQSLLQMIESTKMKTAIVLRIKMIFLRGWAMQVVTNYLYLKALSDDFYQVD